MQGAGGAAAAPSFAEFLERMRAPEAADLVRAIKGFIQEVEGAPPDPDQVRSPPSPGPPPPSSLSPRPSASATYPAARLPPPTPRFLRAWTLSPPLPLRAC